MTKIVEWLADLIVGSRGGQDEDLTGAPLQLVQEELQRLIEVQLESVDELIEAGLLSAGSDEGANSKSADVVEMRKSLLARKADLASDAHLGHALAAMEAVCVNAEILGAQLRIRAEGMQSDGRRLRELRRALDECSAGITDIERAVHDAWASAFEAFKAHAQREQSQLAGNGEKSILAYLDNCEHDRREDWLAHEDPARVRAFVEELDAGLDAVIDPLTRDCERRLMEAANGLATELIENARRSVAESFAALDSAIDLDLHQSVPPFMDRDLIAARAPRALRELMAVRRVRVREASVAWQILGSLPFLDDLKYKTEVTHVTVKHRMPRETLIQLRKEELQRHSILAEQWASQFDAAMRAGFTGFFERVRAQVAGMQAARDQAAARHDQVDESGVHRKISSVCFDLEDQVRDAGGIAKWLQRAIEGSSGVHHAH